MTHQKRTYSEPLLSRATPNEAQHFGSDVPHLAKDSLDTLLSNTEVRLCFGEIDHVLMDLEGCYTLVDLFASIRLHLEEEMGNRQISYVDVAQNGDQEFGARNKTMKRVRLLPGPGRERTYERFLRRLLESALPDGESHFIKMSIHVKGDQGM